MGIFIAYPSLALVVAACFAGFWWWRRRISAALAAIAWCVYVGYEYLMLTRLLCTGECDIRVDLLLIYPVLLILSIIAVVQTLRSPGGSNRRAA